VSEPITNDQPSHLGPDPTDESELLAKFQGWDKALDAHWGVWTREAEEAYSFDACRQWTDDERATMEDSGQIPVTFNLTSPTLDAVAGAEIQNRQQTQFFPREVGDSGVSDALTQGAEYINDECNGDMEDSEAFRDMLICGVGVTNTIPSTDEQDAEIVKDRIDPLEVAWDPSSRKKNFEDARYLRRRVPMSRDAFEDFKEEIGRPDLEGDGQALGDMKRPTIVDPLQRYTHGMLGNGADTEEVIVCEWQWWEREPVHLTGIPQEDGTTQIVPLTPEEHGQAQQIAQQGGIGKLQSKPSTRKVHYRAYVGDGEVLNKEDLVVGMFTYKAMTGKRDRNRGLWFGLVKAMLDPQRFSNKLYSLIIDIVRKNAKGGLMLEEGAVKDIRQFEDSYAVTGEFTWLKDGALAGANGARIQQKVAPPIPQSLFQLMEWAQEMVRKTTGVNEEILGVAGRDQPGILENQRKQAAYGILSPFFDAKRRYSREQGKLLLASMREYLPEDKLLLIVDEGTKKYVKKAELEMTGKYDVIVDESPVGPNQKAKNMAVLTSLMPWLSEADLDAQFWSEAAMFTDFTTGFAEKLSAAFKRKGDQEAQQAQAAAPAQQQAQQVALGKDAADIHLKTSSAQLNEAKTAQIIGDVIDPPPPPSPPMGDPEEANEPA
jgi:hypothetical protein